MDNLIFVGLSFYLIRIEVSILVKYHFKVIFGLYHNFKSSAELNKSGQGFSQGHQWSLGFSHVHGVGSGHDTSSKTWR